MKYISYIQYKFHKRFNKRYNHSNLHHSIQMDKYSLGHLICLHNKLHTHLCFHKLNICSCKKYKWIHHRSFHLGNHSLVLQFLDQYIQYNCWHHQHSWRIMDYIISTRLLRYYRSILSLQYILCIRYRWYPSRHMGKYKLDSYHIHFLYKENI